MNEQQDVSRRHVLKKARDLGVIVGASQIGLARHAANAGEDPVLEFLRRSVDVRYLDDNASRIISSYEDREMPYGLGRRENRHEGIDIADGIGTEILASHYGTAIHWIDEYGDITVQIEHPPSLVNIDGNELKIVIATLYGHLSESYIPLGKRKRVRTGLPIGRMGNSGRSSGISHLHFAAYLWNNSDKHFNPNTLWADGPGQIRCYDRNRQYTFRRLELVYPVACG